jgi:hypothetical protein
MVTVRELRQSGIKVRVLHTRNISPDGSVSCLGGTTTVEITTKDGTNLTGSAKCRDDERFDRKMGLKIAVGRALTSSTGIPKWIKVEQLTVRGCS